MGLGESDVWPYDARGANGARAFKTDDSIDLEQEAKYDCACSPYFTLRCLRPPRQLGHPQLRASSAHKQRSSSWGHELVCNCASHGSV